MSDELAYKVQATIWVCCPNCGKKKKVEVESQVGRRKMERGFVYKTSFWKCRMCGKVNTTTTQWTLEARIVQQ